MIDAWRTPPSMVRLVFLLLLLLRAATHRTVNCVAEQEKGKTKKVNARVKREEGEEEIDAATAAASDEGVHGALTRLTHHNTVLLQSSTFFSSLAFLYLISKASKYRCPERQPTELLTGLSRGQYAPVQSYLSTSSSAFILEYTRRYADR